MISSTGIGALASQKTARFGNALSIVGVSVGVISTLGEVYVKNTANGLPSLSEFALISGVGGVGGLIGSLVADQVGPTELPQTVKITYI